MTDEELEAAVYRAMVERGWVFPRTVEEVGWAEKEMESEGPVELPAELREPCWQRLRQSISDKA